MLAINLVQNVRKLLVVVSFIATTSNAVSQSYYHSPNDTLIAFTTLGNSVTLNITQVHPTADTLLFVWKKLSVDMPSEWSATICDNNTCYPSLIDSAQTLPVLPGDDGLMIIHCTPTTVQGIGIIRYTIQELTGSQAIDTLTWIIDATAMVSVNEFSGSNLPFSISENTMHLQEGFDHFNHVKVISLNGEIVLSQAINQSNNCELPILPSGIYFIELSGKQDVIHQKIWFQNN